MESPLTPFSSTFDMPTLRGRKFTSVVNLCSGFHPRSPSLGNKYESLARGCSTSRLDVIPRNRPATDVRRYAIRPDFLREINISVRRSWRYGVYPRDSEDFPCIPRPELHSWPGISPETSAATPHACLPSKEYFLSFLAISLLELSNAARNHRSLLPARHFKTSFNETSGGLKASKRARNSYMMIIGGGVSSCPLDVPVYDPVPNIPTASPPFPAGACGGRKAREEIDWDVSPSETDIKTVWGGGGRE